LPTPHTVRRALPRVLALGDDHFQAIPLTEASNEVIAIHGVAAAQQPDCGMPLCQGPLGGRVDDVQERQVDGALNLPGGNVNGLQASRKK